MQDCITCVNIVFIYIGTVYLVQERLLDNKMHSKCSIPAGENKCLIRWPRPQQIPAFGF